jgi:hypothetical protein
MRPNQRIGVGNLYSFSLWMRIKYSIR